MNTVSPSIFNKAIVVWTGWGVTAWPQPDEKRLIEHFGLDVTTSVLPELHRLKDELFASAAWMTASDLREMGKIVADQLREQHPELSEEAINALAWWYTYYNK